ncbi:MAG: chloride channel protein [Rhodospirillaceae bacterium]|nr:chloride channel protein [Rhodospirillaceae bacterium]
MARRRGLKPSRILMRLRRIIRNDQLILSILAVFVGAVAGGGVILIREGIDLVQGVFLGGTSENLIVHVKSLPWWQILFAPAVGGLLIGIFIYYVIPGRKPRGIAQVIEASALRGGRMNLRAGIGAAIASAASIGVGGAVGREGPAVHLGATFGAWFAQRLHLTRSLSRALLGCGAAAAVAASFNAPIAGALFAHEVVVGHFAMSAFAPIVIASVVGTIVSRVYFGDFPAFSISEHSLNSFLEFPAVIGLGIASGVIAILFMRSAVLTEDLMQKVPGPQWAKPAFGGFLLGAIALVFPQVLGVGYDATDLALNLELSISLLIALVAMKILATSICIGSGWGGGVFTPALMIGAMLGGAYGIIVTDISPELSSGPGAYTIIGMGAVAAAVLGAPISTTLIVFELTDDYPLTIAVMLAVVISNVVSQQFLGKSFFNWQLERAGLDLKGGFETALLRSIRVHKLVNRDSETVGVGALLQELRSKLQASETGELFVLKENGELFGTITLADLSDAAFDHEVDNLINAGDVARVHPPILDLFDDLETANKVIRDSGEHYIAVVENHETMKFIGTLHETEVMSAYNKALVAARHEEH